MVGRAAEWQQQPVEGGLQHGATDILYTGYSILNKPQYTRVNKGIF